MTPLPRTAISLYVALAVHALVLLALALRPPSQDSPGSGQGLRVRAAALSTGQQHLVSGTSSTTHAPIDVVSPVPAKTVPQAARRLAPAREPARAVSTAPRPERPRPVAAAQPTVAPLSAAVAPAQGGGGRDHYFARLRGHLAGFRRALRPGLRPARSHVRVSITRDGWIEELALIESSGLPELDAEALDLLRRAAPLPAPPGGRAMRLIVPVEIVSSASD